MITKEELIKRSDDVINQLENIIVDIKHEMDFYVDLDETMDEVGTLDNLENGAQLIGAIRWDHGNRYDLLFYVKPELYTKTLKNNQ